MPDDANTAGLRTAPLDPLRSVPGSSALPPATVAVTLPLHEPVSTVEECVQTEGNARAVSDAASTIQDELNELSTGLPSPLPFLNSNRQFTPSEGPSAAWVDAEGQDPYTKSSLLIIDNELFGGSPRRSTAITAPPQLRPSKSADQTVPSVSRIGMEGPDKEPAPTQPPSDLASDLKKRKASFRGAVHKLAKMLSLSEPSLAV
jgi:hypothetical protein